MRKFLRRTAWLVAALVVIGAVLVWGFGLHLYLDGSFTPHIGFGTASQHYDALEAQRAAQRAAGPASAPAPAAPEPAASAPASPSATPTAPTNAPATAATEGTAAAVPAGSASPSIAATPGAAGWSDYRGPARDGVYRQRPLAASWPAGGPRQLWRQPVGEGHASFVVSGGVAYTIEQRRRQEVVAAYDMRTGRELWTNGWDTHFSEAMGGDGPRATPTWAGGVVYALGAAGELRAVRARDGSLVWRTNILDDAGASNLQWAMSGSPLVVDGKVVVQPGGRGASVVAYDAATGKPAWKALDDKQSYVSPTLLTIAGRRQIVTITARRAVGLAVEDGALLWSHPWVNDNEIHAAQPVVVAPNRLFLSSGYGTGAAVIEIAAADGGFAAKEIWANNRMKNTLSSSVVLDGYVYGLDEGILTCVEAATGNRAWKAGRYGHGQLLLAGDRLVITTEDGDLALVKATPSGHEELARVRAIDGRTWNVPAIDDGILLIRNANEMAAFDVR
jgi:outer membrane protein assembly factor BamB